MATAKQVIDIAVKEIGVKEIPANSNKVKYNTWYYGRELYGAAYPWCMAYVQWVFNQADCQDLLPLRTASCSALMNSAKKAGLWVTSGYKPGDVVIYDFERDGKVDHTGIIESVSGSTITAIEGNTSASGSQSNGGMVCRKTRKLNVVVGALRPEYDKEKIKVKDDEDLDIEKLTDTQLVRLAERMQAALGKQTTVSSTLSKEFAEAKAIGITDGSKPCAFTTRAQSAVMNLRAMKSSK